MTSQQEHEIGFWRGLVEHHGAGYRAFRLGEYKDKTQRFEPWWSEQEGIGLEIGCGCVSVLEECGKSYLAIDPLMREYAEFCPAVAAKFHDLYHSRDIEDLGVRQQQDNFFDWLFCVNMLDHTPNPAKAVAEMHRVLKPGGRLYFEVNWDDDEAPAHYGKWTMDNVEQMFNVPYINDDGMLLLESSAFWRCLMYTIERHDAGNQWRYWAIYEKR